MKRHSCTTMFRFILLVLYYRISHFVAFDQSFIHVLCIWCIKLMHNYQTVMLWIHIHNRHPEPHEFSPHPPTVSQRSILISPFQVHLHLLSGLFPSGFPIKIFTHFSPLWCNMRYPCHPPSFDNNIWWRLQYTSHPVKITVKNYSSVYYSSLICYDMFSNIIPTPPPPIYA
jgi:hypothetical protein